MAARSRSDRRKGLERLASCQHGVVSVVQLRALGISKSAIRHALATERLHPVFRGVYALGRAGIDERGRMFAATLACGDGAVISHRSAAALMGLLDRMPSSIDVIAVGSRGRAIDGIRPHYVRPPPPSETGTFDRVPCTSPARMFVDLASVVGRHTLGSAFERAAARKLLDLDAIETAIGCGGRRGTRVLQTVLEEWRPAAAVAGTARLKSPLEAKVLPILAKRGLPMPLCNVPVELAEGRIEVDFLWPEQRFVVEADSRGFHAIEIAFERDRRRDRELMRAGYSTLRLTHRQMEAEANAIVDAIAARLQ